MKKTTIVLGGLILLAVLGVIWAAIIDSKTNGGVYFEERIVDMNNVDPNEPIFYIKSADTNDWIELGEPEELPYIYEDQIETDPNCGYATIGGPTDTVCTKHGRLNWGEPYLVGDKIYCSKCLWQVAGMYLDKHIRTDPNKIGE